MGRLGRKLIRSLKQLRATEWAKETGKRDWEYVRFEIWCSFLDTFYYSWMTPITVFKESCIRTWKWLPIIWKDRHWDSHFILEMLRHKIRFTREHIEECRRHTTWEKDCKNMRIAELLIQRIQDDNYCEAEEEDIRSRYPRPDFCTKDENGRYIWTGPSPEEYKECKKLYKKQKYLKEYDYDFLFKHLKKHLEKWWD